MPERGGFAPDPVDDDLDLADVQRDQILDELRAINRQVSRSGRRWLALVMLIVTGLLWIGAEVHDGNCFSQAQLARLLEIGGDSASYAPPDDDCYLLPWNGGYD